MFDAIAIRRERAANAPDPATRIAELKDKAQYANLAVARIQPAVTAVSTARINAVGVPQHTSGTRSYKYYAYYWSYTVTDAWPPAQPFGPVLTVGEAGGSYPGRPRTEDPQMKQQIQQARSIYMNLCKGGPESQMTEWAHSLTAAVSGGYFGGDPVTWNEKGWTFSSPVIARILPSLVGFGNWLTNAQSTIKNFQAMGQASAASA
jgi:hypothetical protein